MVAISESACTDASTGVRIIAVVYNGLALKDYAPSKKALCDYLVGSHFPEKGSHMAIEVAKKSHH